MSDVVYGKVIADTLSLVAVCLTLTHRVEESARTFGANCLCHCSFILSLWFSAAQFP